MFNSSDCVDNNWKSSKKTVIHHVSDIKGVGDQLQISLYTGRAELSNQIAAEHSNLADG